MDEPVISAPWCGNYLSISDSDIENLFVQANMNSIKRARICTHPRQESIVQEMLIAFRRDSYVRPHLHKNKSESFHVIRGELDVIFFDNAGQVVNRVPLGIYHSGYPFYFRAEVERWHTVLIKSEYALVHEITVGPYLPEETFYPDWAPIDDDQEAVKNFLSSLRLDV